MVIALDSTYSLGDSRYQALSRAHSSCGGSVISAVSALELTLASPSSRLSHHGGQLSIPVPKLLPLRAEHDQPFPYPELYLLLLTVVHGGPSLAGPSRVTSMYSNPSKYPATY